MFLRHEDVYRGISRFHGDSCPAGLYVLPDGGVGDYSLMLVNQVVKNPLGGIALLPRSVQVSQEHHVDDVFERAQFRCLPGRNPSRRRLGGGQCLPDGSPGDPVFPG